MDKNIIEKIIERHLQDGTPDKCREIGIKVDQTLTQDATGTATYLKFEVMGFKTVKQMLRAI